MALIFNNYLKGTNGIMNAFLAGAGTCLNQSTTAIFLYPSTVSFPTTPVVDRAAIPGGYIWSFTLGVSGLTQANGQITLGSTRTANTTAAGTFAWWLIYNNVAAGGTIISDSIGVTGANAIVTVSTLTPTSGQSVTLTAFNLTLV